VIEQRNAGSRAFYHHLADVEIGAARTEFDSTWRTLLPGDVQRHCRSARGAVAAPRGARADRQRPPAVLPIRADSQFDALFPLPGETVSPKGRSRSGSPISSKRWGGGLACLRRHPRLRERDPAHHLLGLYGIP